MIKIPFHTKIKTKLKERDIKKLEKKLENIKMQQQSVDFKQKSLDKEQDVLKIRRTELEKRISGSKFDVASIKTSRRIGKYKV